MRETKWACPVWESASRKNPLSIVHVWEIPLHIWNNYSESRWFVSEACYRRGDVNVCEAVFMDKVVDDVQSAIQIYFNTRIVSHDPKDDPVIQ